MEFGAFLPTYWRDYGQSSVGVAVEATARAAETLGYASVWANDHVIAPQEHAGVGHVIEPLITLASLIHFVPRVQLGTSVLVLPQRNAALVAKQVAALDVLSNGRFIFGLGVGWLRDEFRFLNADFERRSAHTDEAIELMHTLWREDAPTFDGQFYTIKDAVFFPKPARGGPPLWIGGNTQPAIRRAARYGNAWVPYGIGLEQFSSGVETLRRMSEDRETPLVAAHLRVRVGSHPSTGDAEIAGSVEEVEAQVERYQQAGLQYLICDFLADGVDDLLRQMDQLATLVMPRFVA